MAQEYNVTDLENISFLTKDNAEIHYEYYTITAAGHAYFEKRRSSAMNMKASSDFE